MLDVAETINPNTGLLAFNAAFKSDGFMLPSLKYEIQVIGFVIISLITKRTTNNSVLGRLAKNFIRNTPATTW
jgi:membrane protein implicated in regulation of membrane protease activity|tara:strand:- start:541 stop:759 length:219 start_codon:yes stop_codon:yes gene_type:complete